MTPLRLAIAGAGVIGRAYQQRKAARSGCSLAAPTDPSASAMAAVSDAGVPLSAQIVGLIRKERPDGVILATSFAEAQRLVQAQVRTGVPVLVRPHRRYSAALGAARSIVDHGGLGRPEAINCTALFHEPGRYFTGAPRRTRPDGEPILINLVACA